MPKVSVIMSAYNDSKYIRQSIDSILSQTFEDFEFIIIDDASSDDTVQIIESYSDKRIRLICNDENQGLTKNLNKALGYATGEYIARMDGDDISHADRFEKQVKYLDEHSDVVLTGTATHSFGATDLYFFLPDDSEELKIRMLIRPVFAHPTFMFRKKLFGEGIRYDESFRSAQDYEFASRVARDHKIGRLHDVLLEYRVHDKQISQTQNSGQNNNADRVRNKLFENLGLELTEKSFFTSWVREEKLGSAKDYKAAYGIIKKIEGCNNVAGIYSKKKLPVVLKKMLYTWVIRSKSVGYILRFPYICNFSLGNMAIFVGEVMRTIGEKMRKR